MRIDLNTIHLKRMYCISTARQKRYQNSLKVEYLTNHLTELDEIWHMGVFESAFQHGDVSSGVRGTILVSHTKKGKTIVPNGNISQIAWPN